MRTRESGVPVRSALARVGSERTLATRPAGELVVSGEGSGWTKRAPHLRFSPGTCFLQSFCSRKAAGIN